MKYILLFLTTLFFFTKSYNLFTSGNGQLGQLGQGPVTQQITPGFVLVNNNTSPNPRPLNAIKAGCGSIHTVVSLEDGNIYSFGYNNFAQLGIGIRTDSSYSTPQNMTIYTKINPLIIKGSINHFTVILDQDSKTLWSFGNDNNGQLGRGVNGGYFIATPTLVITSNLQGDSIVDVQVGLENSFILTAGGKVYGWGRNANGEVGDGTTAIRSQPTFVAIPGNEVITAISSFNQHTLALGTSQKVFSWGVGTNGQLGSGANANILTPTLIKQNNAVVYQLITHIAAGGTHSIIYDRNANKFFGFGSNTYGVLGDNTITPKNEAVSCVNINAKIGSVDRVAKMVCGGDNLFILTTPSAKIIVFGRNDVGQLGDNSVVSTLIGEYVDTTKAIAGQTIVDVVACLQHSIVITVASSSHTLNSSLILSLISFILMFAF